MKTIIEMAREARLPEAWISETGVLKWSELERFAELVRADEREACAKVCETLWDTPNNGMATEEECYGNECAEVIRARGETAPPKEIDPNQWAFDNGLEST